MLSSKLIRPRVLASNPQYFTAGAKGPDDARACASSVFLSAVDVVNGDGAHYWGVAATDSAFVQM